MTKQTIARPQMVTASGTGSVIKTIIVSALGFLAIIVAAPFIMAALLVGKVSNEFSQASDREYIVSARQSAPGEASLKVTAAPSAAVKAKTNPALSWPVEALSDITATYFLAQKTETMREDRWAFGMPSSGASFAGLTLIQGDTDRFHRNGFLAEALSAVKINGSRHLAGPYYEFTTRFGKFNGRDVIIDDGFRKRTCIGFVSAFDAPYVMLSGVYCSVAGKTADPAPVACMIDRIKFEPEGLQSKLSFLAERSQSGSANCSSKSFHEPGNRNPYYDTRGRMRGVR